MCQGGNKLNCFKATQALGGLTQILIWGFLPDKLRGDLELWYQGGPKIRGGPKILGGAMNPNDAM